MGGPLPASLLSPQVLGTGPRRSGHCPKILGDGAYRLTKGRNKKLLWVSGSSFCRNIQSPWGGGGEGENRRALYAHGPSALQLGSEHLQESWSCGSKSIVASEH